MNRLVLVAGLLAALFEEALPAAQTACFTMQPGVRISMIYKYDTKYNTAEEECQQFCLDDRPLCKGATRNPGSDDCYLMSCCVVEFEDGPMESQSNVESYRFLDCGCTAASTLTPTECNENYPVAQTHCFTMVSGQRLPVANRYRTITALDQDTSEEECQQFCLFDRPTCMGATRNPGNDNCYLSNADGPLESASGVEAYQFLGCGLCPAGGFLTPAQCLTNTGIVGAHFFPALLISSA